MIINEVSISYDKNFLCKISGVLDAVDYCKSIPEFETRMEYQEVFAAVYLDTANNILCHQIISMGGINATVVDLRMIMATALKTLSTSIILCHNHPSGSLSPSAADVKLTNRIKEAAQLFDILVVDHIILTKNSFFSFSNDGKL